MGIDGQMSQEERWLRQWADFAQTREGSRPWEDAGAALYAVLDQLGLNTEQRKLLDEALVELQTAYVTETFIYFVGGAKATPAADVSRAPAPSAHTPTWMRWLRGRRGE